MDLHYGTVKTDTFYFDPDDIFLLQRFKKLLQNSILTQAFHVNIYGMPVPISLWRGLPFTAIFRDIQKCIEQLEFAHAHIPSLRGKYAAICSICSWVSSIGIRIVQTLNVFY